MNYDPPVRPATVLRRAIKLLEEQGWTRNAAHRTIAGKDHYCAVGAMRAACGSQPRYRSPSLPLSYHQAVAALVEVIDGPALHHVANEDAVFRFNDYTARRRYQVVRAMRRAIERLEGDR